MYASIPWIRRTLYVMPHVLYVDDYTVYACAAYASITCDASRPTCHALHPSAIPHMVGKQSFQQPTFRKIARSKKTIEVE